MLIILLLTFGSCAIFKNTSNQRNTINEKERFSLIHGRVKKVTIRSFEALKKDGKIVKGEGIARMDYPPKTIYYNRQQQVTKIQKLNADGSVYSTIANTYDSLGHKIALKIVNAEGELQTKMLFQYDANGRMVERQMFVDGHLLRKRQNFYNDTGKIKKEISYTFRDKSIDTTVYTYTYNSYGDCIELMAKSNGQKSFQTFYEYTYNKNGHIVTKKELDSEIGLKFLWKYNLQGNVKLKKGFEPDGSLRHKVVYTYDKAGNKTEEKVFEDDKLINRNTFTYQGKVYVFKNFWPSGELDYQYTYHYTFDDHGNWVKEVEFMGEDPNTITTRKIEYYRE